MCPPARLRGTLLGGLVGLALLVGCAAPGGPVAPTPSGAPPASGASPMAGGPAAPGGPPAPTRLRFATQFASGGVAAYLAVDRGYFLQEGIALEFERFASNSESIPALATGQVEAGGVSMNAAFWNAAARGVALKAVLDQGSLRPGASFTALVIRKDRYDAGRGHTLADLRGLNLVNTPPGKATTNYCAMHSALERAGVPDHEITIAPLPFPDMPAALANGAIDGGLFAEPFLTHTLKQGTGVFVMGQDAMYPGLTLSVVAFSPELYQNRPLAKGFIRAYLRASRDYHAANQGRTSEADREQIAATLARYTGLDAATIREIYPTAIDPNGQPNVESIRYCYQFFRAAGAVPEPVPEAALEALWGLDLLEEVLGEIGRVEG